MLKYTQQNAHIYIQCSKWDYSHNESVAISCQKISCRYALNTVKGTNAADLGVMWAWTEGTHFPKEYHFEVRGQVTLSGCHDVHHFVIGQVELLEHG